MKNANNEYQQFIGTENWHKLMFGHLATDGVITLCHECECYWFLDVILSYQFDDQVKENKFQTWKLRRTEGTEFIVEATDGNNNVLVTQVIEFSDFEYDELTFWNVGRTIMLPSEY